MGFVYLIGSGSSDKYKIGISKNPPNRLRGLQTGNSLELKLINYYESKIYIKIETILHRTLKHKKFIQEDFKELKGEWFQLTNEDVCSFKENCKRIEDAIYHLKENSTLNITKGL